MTIETYTDLRDFLDRYTDPKGTIQGDPATIASEAVAAGLVEPDEEHVRQILREIEERSEARLYGEVTLGAIWTIANGALAALPASGTRNRVAREKGEE